VVLFDEQSAELSDAAKERLKSLAPLLAGKRNKIELRGHATRRPLPAGSPFQDAWHLSYARCQAVGKYLESQGIEPERIRLSQAGPFEPKTIRAEAESQAENSRVEIYVLAEFVEDLVGTPEERALRLKTP
jgi:chemotaxis protein MotB